MVVNNNSIYIYKPIKTLEDYRVFRALVSQYLDNNEPIHIVFENAVDFINSTFVGFMILLRKKHNAQVFLTVKNEELYLLFEVLGLQEILNIKKDFKGVMR